MLHSNLQNHRAKDKKKKMFLRMVNTVKDEIPEGEVISRLFTPIYLVMSLPQ